MMALLAQIRAFLEPWAPRRIVADATGIGHGLVTFLHSPAVFGDRVVPFVFTTLSKAELGSAFLSVIETGRFQYFAGDDEDCRQFWRECSYCAYSIRRGRERSTGGCGGACRTANAIQLPGKQCMTIG